MCKLSETHLTELLCFMDNVLVVCRVIYVYSLGETHLAELFCVMGNLLYETHIAELFVLGKI